MMNVEKLFKKLGCYKENHLDIDNVKVSPPKVLMNVDDFINTAITLTTDISRIVINYRRVPINKLVKFTNESLAKTKNNKAFMVQYLNDFYDLEITEEDFELGPNSLEIKPNSYLYVGKVLLRPSDEALQFNVTHSDYYKINTLVSDNEGTGLYEFLLKIIPNFSELNLSSVESIFSFTINSEYIELILNDKTQLLFINGAIDG